MVVVPRSSSGGVHAGEGPVWFGSVRSIAEELAPVGCAGGSRVVVVLGVVHVAPIDLNVTMTREVLADTHVRIVQRRRTVLV